MSVRIAVVGHVEWVQFLVVPQLPRGGEVEHAQAAFSRAAGGGGVAAGVLAELGAEVELFTAFGDDHTGEQAAAQLRSRGITVHAAERQEPSRRAVSLLQRGGERSIVTIGARLAPLGSDPLPWERLAGVDAVYFTAGDLAALRHARRARVLSATPRAGSPLGEGPPLDALIWSASDSHESRLAEAFRAHARVLVATDGEHGGRWWRGPEPGGVAATLEDADGRWQPVAPPGQVHDSYGAGDAFAAAVTFALGGHAPLREAIVLGARWGARMLARVGAP